MKPKPKSKRKTLKKLAKENKKLSNWIKAVPEDVEEIVVDNGEDREHFEMEVEVERKSNQPSSTALVRILKRDELLESWWSVRMFREVVLEMVRDVPWHCHDEPDPGESCTEGKDK